MRAQVAAAPRICRRGCRTGRAGRDARQPWVFALKNDPALGANVAAGDRPPRTVPTASRPLYGAKAGQGSSRPLRLRGTWALGGPGPARHPAGGPRPRAPARRPTGAGRRRAGWRRVRPAAGEIAKTLAGASDSRPARLAGAFSPAAAARSRRALPSVRGHPAGTDARHARAAQGSAGPAARPRLWGPARAGRVRQCRPPRRRS